MDNKFYQDEFEQFLQDEVKQHRMYPSDHIWKNIRTEIHGYTAWPALTFISLFIITALTVSTLLINDPTQRSKDTALILASIKKSEYSNSAAKKSAIARGNQEYIEQLAPEQITAETFAANLEQQNLPSIAATSFIKAENELSIQKPIDQILHTSDKVAIASLVAPETTILQNTIVPAATATESEDNLLYANSSEENVDATNLALNTSEAFKSKTESVNKEYVPYVMSSPFRKNSKFGFQFYITPSTSYRKLSDDKVKEIIQPAAIATSAQNISLSSNFAADINNVVRHKPALGLELGFAILYNMSSRLKFKTGVQLNVRQYYIETFQSANDLATISLINYRGVESFNFYSPYNNNTGYKKTQLDNKLYQVSIPIGIQWEIIQGKRFGVNTEASIQPTMTLNNNTYLMSTDYKHYTNGGDFIRKWNINTSVGLNIYYKTGSYTWQLGPQVRYQHLPTYSNVYPIREYLMDYGVRLGITRQLK